MLFIYLNKSFQSLFYTKKIARNQEVLQVKTTISINNDKMIAEFTLRNNMKKGLKIIKKICNRAQ